MFDGPEHESYVSLCCGLRLERRFEDGDWFWWPGDESDRFPEGVYLQHRAAMEEYDIPQALIAGDEQADPYGERPNPLAVWAPRLDQWLDMLEEAGVRDVGFFRGVDHAKCVVLFQVTAADALDFGDLETAPTREEAAAKLWMAVTGRTVGS